MAAGDAAAIEAFYRSYFDALLGMSATSLRMKRYDEARCLDVVHDAMLRIVRCVKPMQTEAHLLNWCRLVIRSCALDRLRREQRRARRERANYAGEASDADDLSEQIAWLDTQVAALDPTLAKIIRLRFVDGWTLARISTLLDTTTGKVDGQLRRAIQKLRTDAQAAFGET
jgi:RNA polymerase sigma factor (sigma-70 family)